MQPVITAVVLNYRSPRRTVACIQSLLQQTISHSLEILLIDNHSDDESIGLFHHLFDGNPVVRILETRENVGYSRANNLALIHARGEYLFITNPDHTFPETLLSDMLSIVQKDETIGVLAPSLQYPSSALRPSARLFPTPFDLFYKRFFSSKWTKNYESFLAKQHSSLIDIDWLAGTCLLLRTSLFTALGGFDERFFLFFEDTDFCRRIHQMGLRIVYAKHLHAFDQPERLSGSSIFSLFTSKLARIHFVSAIRYFWKWGACNKKTPY